MKVLMIYPAVERYYRSITGPSGVLSISTFLKANGHEVKFVDRCVKRESIKGLFAAFKPEICGISFISTRSIADVHDIYTEAKNRGVPVIAGGPLSSTVPEMVINEGYADMVIKGEGEITWLETLRALENGAPLSEVDGLCYKENGVFNENKDREFADLSLFPPIDWTIAGDPSVYFQTLFSFKNIMYIYTAKGCVGQCTFCFSKNFQKGCFRKRPMSAALTEIKFLKENYGLDGVHFCDELWCKTREQVYDNCRAISESNLNFAWGCNFRIGQLKNEDFEYMYSVGCRWIFFGIESGSEYTHKLMKKGIQLDKVYETVKACYDAGITPICSFIMGFPGERIEDLKKTCALIKKISFAMFDCSFFYPQEGTEIYEELVAKGEMQEYKTLQDLRYPELDEFKFITLNNHSKVPTRDLKVVRSWILWQSFTRKTPGKKGFFGLKAVRDAVLGLFGGGFKHFLISFKRAADMFTNVVFNVFIFRRILKKYGLK